MPAQQHFGERPSQHHQPCCCLLTTLLQLAKTLADEGCKVSDSAPFKGAAVLSALALLLDSARMSGLQSQLHTLQVPGDSPVGLSTGRELTQQVGGSDLISQLPAILAEAEQEVFLLQAAAAKLPEADHSTKTVFEFNSSRFNNVPTLLLYVPVVLFFTPDVPNGYAVLQSPLLEFAADLLDLTVNMHNLLSNTSVQAGLGACRDWRPGCCLQDGLPSPPFNASAHASTSCQHGQRQTWPASGGTTLQSTPVASLSPSSVVVPLSHGGAWPLLNW